jgi:hypothetical protein
MFLVLYSIAGSHYLRRRFGGRGGSYAIVFDTEFVLAGAVKGARFGARNSEIRMTTTTTSSRIEILPEDIIACYWGGARRKKNER